MSEKKRIVMIGTGGRANAYTQYGAKDHVMIVGVADPHQGNRKTFLGLNDLVGLVPEFDDWSVMLDQVGPVDGAVITTPNHQHEKPAIECMKRGIVLALEKPIAENPEACRAILEAKRRYKARVTVGFVMRSSPFYRQAKQWIDEGRIGSVSTIQADEIPHPLTTSVMFRSDWRRYRQSSGGAMNEKCCHDLDMLGWLIGSDPVRLSSVAGVKSLGPRADRPERCADCGHTAECIYYMPPKVYNHPDMVKKANDGLLYKFVRDNSACIYNNGHDLYDHQQVLLEYADGATASLTLDFSASVSQSGRYLKVIGTEGVIWGKVEKNIISIQSKHSDQTEIVELKTDDSGHGGANLNHAMAFFRQMSDPSFREVAGVEDGFLSSMLCFAADEAADAHRVIDVSGMVSEAHG